MSPARLVQHMGAKSLPYLPFVVVQDFRPNGVIELFWRTLLDIGEDAEYLPLEVIA